MSTTTFGFDADDNIVSYHGAVLKVSGGVASSFATLTDGFASGLATDSAGNVFVSSQKFDDTVSTIYKVTPEGTVSTFGFDETIQGSVPGQCFGLAFDSAGNLFAAGAGNSTNTVGAIYKFTSGGVRTIFVGEEAFTSGPGPIDLTFDSSGSLFVSTSDLNSNGEIRRFAPDGTEITPQFATGLTKSPRGLRFDSDGNLFLAEIGVPGTTIIGDILKFTPGGSFTYFDDGATGDFGTRGNRGPEFLAFSPPAITLTPPSTSDGVPTCELPPATISVFRTSGGVVGSIDESVYLLASDSGSNFRIDTANCKYVYNLGSKSLGPGTYQVFISIGGSVAGSATFALK